MRLDPRLEVVAERLKNTGRIIAFASGKGGVGKTLIAATAALLLARSYKVGLLDLDFYGPSSHIPLGAKLQTPREERGVIPPRVGGISFMSIAHYLPAEPIPLRGQAYTNLLLEVLAITRWGRLDFLLVDMPPGYGEATLDLARLVGRAEFLVVTTSSPLAIETARKTLRLLDKLGAKVTGVLENMWHGEGRSLASRMAEELEVEYLGALPYDPAVEGALGEAGRLLKTRFARSLEGVLAKWF
jgi:ATP-binding protein involved in chromosome partitioning